MKKSKSKGLGELMQLATLSDLKSFTISYAYSDSQFNDALTKFLSDKYLAKEDGGKELVARLDRAFGAQKNVGNRYHSYYVADWERITSDAIVVLKDARRLCEIGNATAALKVACRLFELVDGEDLEMVDPYDDDLQMSISDILDQAEDLMLKSLENKDIPQEEKVKAVELLKGLTRSEIDNLMFLDMDDLLKKVTELCLTDEDKLAMIDNIIAENVREYGQDVYISQKIELLRKMGREEEAEATAAQHLDLYTIRKDEIEWAAANGDFEKALRLVREGREDAQEKGRAGMEKEWMRKELDLYGLMKDQERQAELARQLFILGKGDLDDYELLKKIVPQVEWKDFLARLLAETDLRVSSGSSVEADIYVEEKDGDNLFRLLMGKEHHNFDMYEKYARHVGDVHAPVVLLEFVAMTKDYAAQNMGAVHYERIRCAMEAMTKLKGGKTAAKQLAQFFRETYSRRTSFMAAIKKF